MYKKVDPAVGNTTVRPLYVSEMWRKFRNVCCNEREGEREICCGFEMGSVTFLCLRVFHYLPLGAKPDVKPIV